MEGNPIYAPVMALQDKFDDSICVAEHIGLVLVSAVNLLLEGHGCWRRVLLPETGYVPYAYRLIEGCGDDQVLGGVEVCTHDIVVVAGHGANQRSVLPVPYPDGLIVGTGDDPWELVVEEDGSNVVQVPIKCKQLPSRRQRPDLDLVIITTGHKQWLSLVEVDASDGAAVAFQSVDQGSHPVCNYQGIPSVSRSYNWQKYTGYRMAQQLVKDFVAELRSRRCLCISALPVLAQQLCHLATKTFAFPRS